MSIPFELNKVLSLSPGMNATYKKALALIEPHLLRHGILENKKRLCHFLAQIMHETGSLRMLEEGLYYRADRLPAVWPARFKPKGSLDPALYAGNPEKLANEMYGGRMGNKNPGDGYKYRGRGGLQTTGFDNYNAINKKIKQYDASAPDFVANPDNLLLPEWCLRVAAINWELNGCNAAADEDSVEKVTRKVNGGVIGLSERIKLYNLVTKTLA